jgi:hypothetical protein
MVRFVAACEPQFEHAPRSGLYLPKSSQGHGNIIVCVCVCVCGGGVLSMEGGCYLRHAGFFLVYSSTMKMEATCSSETSISFLRTTLYIRYKLILRQQQPDGKQVLAYVNQSLFKGKDILLTDCMTMNIRTGLPTFRNLLPLTS